MKKSLYFDKIDFVFVMQLKKFIKCDGIPSWTKILCEREGRKCVGGAEFLQNIFVLDWLLHSI